MPERTLEDEELEVEVVATLVFPPTFKTEEACQPFFLERFSIALIILPTFVT